MNLMCQFDSFTRRIVAGVSSALVVWINSIIVYQTSIIVLLFLIQRFLLKQLELWRGTSSIFNFFNLIPLLVLLASVLASTKPAWLNFGQHRGPTYSYNEGSKKRQKSWASFTISIANNKHNTKGHHVIKTKDLNKNWLAKWQNTRSQFLSTISINRMIRALSSSFCQATEIASSYFNC